MVTRLETRHGVWTDKWLIGLLKLITTSSYNFITNSQTTE
jgi:hypothetical protein